MKTTTSYNASGLVYGSYWGGGEGAYQARTYQADTLEALREQIEKDVASGAVDSGMGYERVHGAYMMTETVTRTTIDGKQFTNVEAQGEFFGTLSEEAQDFLIHCINY